MPFFWRMKAMPFSFFAMLSVLAGLSIGSALASEESLRQGRAALAGGQYLRALEQASRAYAADYQPGAAAFVMAQAADLGNMARGMTEQLYLRALAQSRNTAPVLGSLTVFYLRSGQITKAAESEAAFVSVCRYNCAGLKAQIRSERRRLQQ